MVIEEQKQRQSSQDQKQPDPVAENGENVEGMFSPRFKSVAAMAGWDMEAILVASLVVEDTPVRESKHKKRSDPLFKTPPSNSRRKRRVQSQRRSPVSVPMAVLDLGEEESVKEESEKNKPEVQVVVNEENKSKEERKKREDKLTEQTKEEKKVGEGALTEPSSSVSGSNLVLPCIDKLREELSCAICLEICYEPSTTSCGHSFCKKCLRSAADKCGKKCPKCRQLISNGRSCTVNTVLWNTIQLLFPQEVEARKAAAAENHQTPQRGTTPYNVRTRSIRPAMVSSRDSSTRRREIQSRGENNDMTQSIRPSLVTSSREARATRRRGIPSQDETAALALRIERENLARLISSNAGVRRSRGTPRQDEDADLALRLQREEFMEAFGGSNERSGEYLSSARANLRAIASRAIDIRMRGHNPR